MKVIVFLHSNKESMWEKAEEIGLSEEAIKMFKYALSEVEFTLDVNDDGTYEILEVNGRKLNKIGAQG